MGWLRCVNNVGIAALVISQYSKPSWSQVSLIMWLCCQHLIIGLRQFTKVLQVQFPVIAALVILTCGMIFPLLKTIEADLCGSNAYYLRLLAYMLDGCICIYPAIIGFYMSVSLNDIHDWASEAYVQYVITSSD